MKPILTLSVLALALTSAVAQTPQPPQTPQPSQVPDTTKAPVAAPPAAPALTFSGQVRERTEIDGRAFTQGMPPDAVHYLRTRLAATAKITEKVSAMLEVQDARAFGQTRSTLNAGAPAFDVRQAWVQVKDIAGAPISIKIGRQAIGYANERLVGKIEWSNTAQSFDAAVATLGLGDVSIDFLGAAIARNPNTTRYTRDVFLTGMWGAWKQKDGPVAMNAFFLFDNPRADSIRRQNRFTTGFYANGAFDGLDFEIDGAYQFGDHIQEGAAPHTLDIGASLVGVRAGYTIKEAAELRIGVGYDRLSGNDPTDSTSYGAFHTLYATNHKFYGYMDYLLNIPVHTKGLGLQDLIGSVSFVPIEKTKLSLEAHLFLLETDPSTLTPPVSVAETTIGRELDLTLAYAPSKTVNLTLGYSVFDGDRDRLVLAGFRKTTQWGYGMLTVGF